MYLTSCSIKSFCLGSFTFLRNICGTNSVKLSNENTWVFASSFGFRPHRSHTPKHKSTKLRRSKRIVAIIGACLGHPIFLSQQKIGVEKFLHQQLFWGFGFAATLSEQKIINIFSRFYKNQQKVQNCSRKFARLKKFSAFTSFIFWHFHWVRISWQFRQFC